MKTSNIIKIDFLDKVLPQISEDLFTEIKEDIKQRGIQTPLIISQNNKLLSGYIRLRIAEELNIENIPVNQIDFDDKDESKIKEYYILDNLNRRIISKEERARIIFNLYESMGDQRGQNDPFDRKEKIASIFNISKKTVQRDINEIKKELDLYEEKLKARPYQKIIASYDSNMLGEMKYFPIEIIKKEAKRKDINLDKTYGIDLGHYNQNHEKPDIRFFDYNNVPTITTNPDFFHPNGMEFSIREYGSLQDFPNDFKFSGNFTNMKKQIGNAVSPKMASYIIKKYIGKEMKNYIDLFSGVGGFSHGANLNDKICKFALDFDRLALLAHEANFPFAKHICEDIKKVNIEEIHKKVGEIDFIIGSPVCTGFSKANGKTKTYEELIENEINLLYLDYLKFVSEFQPKKFIMENVVEMKILEKDIIENCEKIGYKIEFEEVCGSEIGMRQKRRRLFIVGNKIQ